MNDQRTLDALNRFLDYLKDKGLMKAATVHSRKATANKVFSVLPAEERSDVTAVDLDDVMTRFANLEGQKYTPGSLQTYKSRLTSTLDDFSAYLKDPMGFRPSVQHRAARSKPSTEEGGAKVKSNESGGKEQSETGQSKQYTPPPDVTILPIPLRADLVVRVQGLPFDLTAAEANKIANVIRAMAILEE